MTKPNTSKGLKRKRGRPSNNGHGGKRLNSGRKSISGTDAEKSTSTYKIAHELLQSDRYDLKVIQLAAKIGKKITRDLKVICKVHL